MAQNIPINLFEVPRQNIWNSFSNHLEGSHIGAFLIVSSSLLSEEAKTALLNSSKALGYGTINTTFLTLKNSDDSDTHTAKLEHQEIFRIVESLDPLCVVVTDHGAIEEVARAFRARLEMKRLRPFWDITAAVLMILNACLILRKQSSLHGVC